MRFVTSLLILFISFHFFHSTAHFDHRFLESTCLDGQFSNGTDCLDCPTNCSTCQNNTENLSLTCQNCSSGYYLNSSLALCLQCPINCLDCSPDAADDSIVDCASCDGGLLLNNSTNQCDDCNSSSYYGDDNNCYLCPENCSSCIYNYNDNGADCTGCNDGFWYDFTNFTCDEVKICSSSTTYHNNSDNTCYDCPNNCTSCNYNESNPENENVSCLECQDGSFNNVSFGSCDPVPTCGESQYQEYYNTTDNLCYNCPENCTSCEYNDTNSENNNVTCNNCNSDSFYNSTFGKCDDVPHCNDNEYYNSIDNDCYVCPDHCSKCMINENNNIVIECTECLDNYFFNSSYFSCDQISHCSSDN